MNYVRMPRKWQQGASNGNPAKPLTAPYHGSSNVKAFSDRNYVLRTIGSECNRGEPSKECSRDPSLNRRYFVRRPIKLAGKPAILIRHDVGSNALAYSM
jgi:hypothetical protein